MTAAEAFLLQLAQRGLAGDSAAARASLEAIESARLKTAESTGGPTKIIVTTIDSGADAIIGTLGIAKLKYPTDEHRVRWELNPWIVENALERLGDRQLSLSEQKEVWGATRTPQKVEWPEWWSYCG